MRRPAGRALLFLFVLVAVGLLLFAWTRSSGRRPSPTPLPSPAPTDRLRIGTLGRPATLPVWALGRLIQGQPLKLEIQTFEDPGLMWEMLAAGQLDVVLTTLDQFALALPRHDPGVLLFPSARSRGSDAVVARPEIKTPEDLKGRRIAYVDGTAGQYLVLNFLASHSGVDFEAVAARNPEEAAAWLRKGDVAAAALWQPWLESLEGDGFRPLWSSSQVPVTEVWVASRQILRGEGPGQVGLEAVAGAWFSLVERLRTTPGLAVSAIAEETQQDSAALQVALGSGMEFLTLDEARAFDPQALVDALQALRNDWSLHGAFRPPLTPRHVEPGGTVDFTLLQKLSLPDTAGLTTTPAPEASPTPEESPAPDESPASPPEPSPTGDRGSSPSPFPEEETPAETPAASPAPEGSPPAEEAAPPSGPGTRPEASSPSPRP